MILIAVICTNSYDYKTFIAGFQFAEGVNIQFKSVVTSHDAQGIGFAGYYLTPAAARRPDAEDLVAMVDARLRMPSAVDPWDYNPNSVRKPYERNPVAACRTAVGLETTNDCKADDDLEDEESANPWKW